MLSLDDFVKNSGGLLDVSFKIAKIANLSCQQEGLFFLGSKKNSLIEDKDLHFLKLVKLIKGMGPCHA
jgi:hypothetical protein